MADRNSNTRLTPPEIYALADRLTADAQLPMFQVQPRTRKDIRIVARLLRHLLENGVINAPIILNVH